MKRRLTTTISAMAVATALGAGRAEAAETEATGGLTERSDRLTLAEPLFAGDAPERLASSRPASQPAAPVTLAEPVKPFTFNVKYYLYSDYVFRGINFSEYAKEGRERPNHQMTTSLSVPLTPFGTVGYDTFFEWYGGQKAINPVSGGQDLQEVDHSIWWEYAIKPIYTTARVTYTFYTFPNLAALLRTDAGYANNNNDMTSEYSITLTHNDAWMWKWLWPKNEDGVLNPRLFFAQDVGIAAGGMWMEMGVNHGFKLAPDLLFTPSYTLTTDIGYLRRLQDKAGDHDGSRLAYQQFGLDLTYDVSRLLHLPPSAGAVTLSGFLFYNDAFHSEERDNTIQDQFFGGMAVGWTF